MGSDDTTLDTDPDLDLDDDVDTDDLPVDTFDDLDDDTEVKDRRQAQAKVAQKFEREKKAAAQREAALMDGLKSAWADDALKEFPLADVSAIGLTGIDADAKAKFLAEVKAQHEAREHALSEAGYVRLDGDGKPIERPEPAAAPTAAGSAIEAERQAAAGWGKPLTGTDVQQNERAMQEKELMDAMKGGPRDVINLMFKRNKGLTNFITRK